MWTTKGSHTLVRVAGTEHSTHLLSSATNAYMAGALGRMGVWEPALYHLPHSPKIQQRGSLSDLVEDGTRPPPCEGCGAQDSPQWGLSNSQHCTPAGRAPRLLALSIVIHPIPSSALSPPTSLPGLSRPFLQGHWAPDSPSVSCS